MDGSPVLRQQDLKGFDTPSTLWHRDAILSIAMKKGAVMPKAEWGVKRLCPNTGKRFYDLNKNPVISPYTGEIVVIDTDKGSRTLFADKPDAASKVKATEAEDSAAVDDDVVVLDDDDDDDDDDDLGDDVLEDDDDDTVALDDLADVAIENDDD